MQALINGTLDRLKRTSERLAIERASTLRAHDGRPIDVMIEDISVTGCRIRTSLPFTVQDELMIGLPGVGTRTCRVIWSNDGEIGCEFEAPLSFAELEETRVAQTLRQGRFSSVAFPVDHAPEAIQENRLAAGHSLLVIIAAAAGAWLLLAGVAVLAYRMLGF